MSAATQNEMERLRKERDEHEQARTALEEEPGQVILERDEAFARGKQVFEELKRVEQERDALAAHVERLISELEDRSMTNDPKAASEHYWQCADEIEPHVSDGSLTASVVESFEFLLGFWLEAGKPTSLARRDLIKQAEGAAMVAESAWSRRHLKPFGNTPEECAANLARLKADAAAEALEAFSRAKGPNGSPPEGDSFTAGWDAAFESVDSEATRYRRQAKGGER